MTFDYIDIHSHLYFPDFDADREEEIQKLKDAKIAAITIGTDFDSSEKAIALAEKHDHLFATVGEHPGHVTEGSESYDISYDMEKLAMHNKVLAIGECGLDYYRMDENNLELKQIQKKIFQQHIDLALKLDKPLMLHIRPQKGTMDAYLDALEILEKNFALGNPSGKGKLRGNVHFFVGNLDVLKRFLDIGFTVSFTGVITFARDYDEIVRYAPLDMIMSETDSPFVAPVPHRGKRNSPLYVPEVVKKIAELKELPFEEVQKAMVDNAMRNFSFS